MDENNMNRMEEEQQPVMIHGKPVQVGSFDEYHFCMPDTTYFDVADVLVLELSFACVVIKNIGMRGDDKLYKMVDGKKGPISRLDFVEAGVSTCNLQMPIDQKYTGKPILFDARERERMLFGHIGM